MYKVRDKGTQLGQMLKLDAVTLMIKLRRQRQFNNETGWINQSIVMDWRQTKTSQTSVQRQRTSHEQINKKNRVNQLIKVHQLINVYWIFKPVCVYTFNLFVCVHLPSSLSLSRRLWNSAWKISICFSMRTFSQTRASGSSVLSCKYTRTRRCSSNNRVSA